MDLTPGAVIAGRYRVDRKVGSGGMGEVWVGEHRTVGSRVAIKTLLPAAALNHEVVARFKREAYILGRIRSDHVARVVDFVADDVFGLVLVMEFIEGDALSRVLSEGPLSVEDTIELGADVASALVDLHEAHIVHRDLKPGNILLQPIHGERRRRAVVVDFGVSRLNSTGQDDGEEEITGITRADMAVGTLEYMAPEQILNSRDATGVSDIYALGAILYRAAAGRHVFGNITSDADLARRKLSVDAPPLELPRNDNLARLLSTVVMRALKRRPSERYKTAQELLNALIPIREMARIAQSDLDSTTVDQKSMIQAILPGGAPLPPGTRGSVTPPTGVTPPSMAQSNSRPSIPSATPPVRRGIPGWVLLLAVAAALAGGAVLGGSGFLNRGGTTSATSATPTASESAAIPTASATASATPTASVEAEPIVPAASASAAAAPSGAASAAASGIALDAGAAPTASVKLWGKLPTPSPSSGSAPLSSASAAVKAPTNVPDASAF